MALSVGTVTANITGDPTGFNRAIDGVRRKGASVAQSVQQSFRNVGRRMQSIGTQMTAGLTLPLLGAGTLAVKTAGDYESLRVAMDTLNGSAEEGARNFERLKEFSAETPFQLQDLASAQNMLQGFSLSADEAFESISMIGDIAAVTGGDIKGIGIAFGQAAAEGRLMTRDIRQLINQGVPAIQLLADTMDVGTDQVLNLASEGKVSFEILQQAFRDATEEGGIFANGMEKQANTIKGVFSTLRDNIDIALGEIGNSLVETFDIKGIMHEMISSIQTGIEWFNNLSQETRQAAFTIAGLLGASGPIIAAIGTLSLAIGTISAPIAGVVAAFTAGTAAIVSNWDSIVTYFTSGSGARVWDSIRFAVSGLWSAIKGLFRAGTIIVQNIWNNWGKHVFAVAQASFSGVLTVAGALFKSLAAVLHAFAGDWRRTWINIVEAAAGIMSALAPATGAALKAQAAVMRAQLDNQSQMADEYAQDIKEAMNEANEALSGAGGLPPETGDGRETPPIVNVADIQAASVATMNLGTSLQFNNSQLQMAAVSSEAMRQAEIARAETLRQAQNATENASVAAQRFGSIMGNALSQAVLHGNNLLDVLKNLAKQLASRALVKGLTLLLSGGTSGLLGGIGSLFGGIFHSGGVVGGSGERMILAQGGEGVFTPSQMRAMGTLINSRPQASVSESMLQRSFEKALNNTVQEVSPSRVFELSQQGKRGY